MQEQLYVQDIFRHESDLGLEGLKGYHNLGLNLESLSVVLLVPDLLLVIEMIDLFIEFAARKPVWPWKRVLDVVRVLKVAIVGLIMIMQASQVCHLGLGTFFLLVDFQVFPCA